MKSKVFFVVTLFWVLFISTTASAQQEEITLSTYYPAPYGEYDELCAEKLLVDLPSAAELQDMARGDCHITRSLIVGSGAGTGFSYDELEGIRSLPANGDVLIRGNVGIGTTSPRVKLDLAEQNTGQVILLGERFNPNVRVGFGLDSATAGMRIFTTDVGGNFIGFGTIASGDGTTWSEKARITSDGNVGIGTTAPGATLEVSRSSASSNNLYLRDTGAGTPGLRLYSTGNASPWGVYAYDNSYFAVGVIGVNEPFAITRAGNVGIGTTSPQAKLDVTSTTSGFLPPRMTTVQRDNIATPPAGSIIYNTDANGLNLYNGSTWQGMAGWVKIAEVDLIGSGGYTFTNLDGNTHKVYKVIFQGYLAAGGADRRILIRVNGSASGYRGYAVFDGDAAGANWDDTGFYVGRNGWGQNADFGFEYTISAMSGRRHVGFGEATFAMYPTAILGYGRASGYWNNTSNVTSLWVGPSGGAISGKLILLALQ